MDFDHNEQGDTQPRLPRPPVRRGVRAWEGTMSGGVAVHAAGLVLWRRGDVGELDASLEEEPAAEDLVHIDGEEGEGAGLQ